MRAAARLPQKAVTRAFMQETKKAEIPKFERRRAMGFAAKTPRYKTAAYADGQSS